MGESTLKYTREHLTLLVSSFDGYAPAWSAFCHGLRTYYPEHPPVAFVTNSLAPPCGRAIRVGPDRGWSNNLATALDLVKTPYLLYAQEDYWIQQAVNASVIESYIELLDRDKADYIRLLPVPGPDEPFADDERLGVIADGSRYRASLQMALWRTSVLRDLLVSGESGWQFELRGSRRSDRYRGRFLSVTKRRHGVDYLFTAIVDGQWIEGARRYAEREGIEIDFDALPPVPWHRPLTRRLRNTLARLRRSLVEPRNG